MRKDKILLRYKSLKVLKLILENGPINTQCVFLLLDKCINKNGVYKIIQRLIKLKLIQVHRTLNQGTALQYYYVDYDNSIDTHISTCKLTMLRYQTRKYSKKLRELTHHQNSVIIKHLLARALTNFRILSDDELFLDPKLCQNLLLESYSAEFIPDLIIERKGAAGVTNYIAIEIERTAKSKTRLKSKFIKYIQRSKFNGVIYLYENQSLLSLLVREFTHQMKKLPMFYQQKINFFMFGSLQDFCNQQFQLHTLNSSKHTLLTEWLNHETASPLAL